MRTVYLGTSEFAADVLRTLAGSSHRPQLVVTPPDRKQGRGRKLASPPVADAARELGIELLQTADANDEATLAAITAAEPEAIGICAFGQLIKEPLLSLRPMFNVHTSLLPRWRGAAPIERALMAGDTKTGVTIFELEAGLDTGRVALEREEPIAESDTYGTLAPRLAELGGRLLVETFDLLAAGKLELTPQPEEGVTYADKIDPAERRLDPSRPAAELVNVVRALTPHIGAYVELEGGDRLGAVEVAVADVQAPAGRLLADGERLLLGTSDGTLELLEVKPAGKKRDDRQRVPARPARTAVAGKLSVEVTASRRCAFAVVRRVFEQDAYADRAFRAEADRLGARRARSRLRDATRLRHRSAQADARPPDRALREARARRARPARAGGAAARHLPGRVHGAGARPRGGRRERRAGEEATSPGPPSFVNAILRRATREAG